MLQLSSKNLNHLYLKANHNLRLAEEWFNCNLLSLNTKKTKYMLFFNQNHHIHYKNLYFAGDIIERIGEDCKTKSFKFLGTLIDDQLNWVHHLNSLKNKLNSANFALAQVKNILPMFARKAIYESLAKSHLNFSNVIYGSCKQTLLNKIEQTQKKLVRNLANQKFHCHANPIFKSMGLVKVSDLIKINQIIMVKKFKKGFLPATVEPLFIYKSEANERLTIGHLDHFAAQLPGKYNIGLFPINEACKAWNTCPAGIKNLPKLKQIKSALIEFFISKYSTICSNVNCYPCTQSV